MKVAKFEISEEMEIVRLAITELKSQSNYMDLSNVGSQADEQLRPLNQDPEILLRLRACLVEIAKAKLMVKKPRVMGKPDQRI